MEPGRNDPCPCGSGKKYKKCCGAAGGNFAAAPVRESGIDYVGMNHAIAYVGKIGKIREDFCRDYTTRKQAALKRIEQDQNEKTAAQGEKITCHKGCSTCCTQYILGTLQECEAIVYYLYQHEEALAHFVRAYPAWRERVRQNEAIFKAVKDAVDKQIQEGPTEANRQAYDIANVRFMLQNIPCPFLKQGGCSIHEVRPWNCAKPVTTTPCERCHPLTNSKNEQPKVYMSDLVPEELPLYRPTKALNVLLIHIGVWELLTGGYSWLSTIPGLEDIGKEVMGESQVQQILTEFLAVR